MKTFISQRILLVIGFSALLANPAFAAFGDDTTPSPSALNGNSAAGFALPPGTYPSSPADSDKKAETSPQEKPSPSSSKQKPHDGKAPKKQTPRTGS
ncbi:hypothetical protein [Pseudomonas sp. SDO5271_S396]